jgi:hypothetical protein
MIVQITQKIDLDAAADVLDRVVDYRAFGGQS